MKNEEYEKRIRQLEQYIINQEAAKRRGARVGVIVGLMFIVPLFVMLYIVIEKDTARNDTQAQKNIEKLTENIRELTKQNPGNGSNEEAIENLKRSLEERRSRFKAEAESVKNLAGKNGERYVVPAPPGPANPLSKVTGFHEFQNDKNGYAVRLLEWNESNTKELNPVALYVVADNRLKEGKDNQIEDFLVWRLPDDCRVAELRSVEQTENGIRIKAIQDREEESERRTGAKATTIEVTYSMAENRLERRLTVLKKEKQ